MISIRTCMYYTQNCLKLTQQTSCASNNISAKVMVWFYKLVYSPRLFGRPSVPVLCGPDKWGPTVYVLDKRVGYA